MTQAEKDRALEMFKMRLDGATYQTIADKYGITKQRVEQILGRTRVKQAKLDYVVYSGLREWMSMYNMRMANLEEMLQQNGCCSGRCKDKLTGKTQFKLNEIKVIISASGLTFEELFMKENICQE